MNDKKYIEGWIVIHVTKTGFISIIPRTFSDNKEQVLDVAQAIRNSDQNPSAGYIVVDAIWTNDKYYISAKSGDVIARSKITQVG